MTNQEVIDLWGSIVMYCAYCGKPLRYHEAKYPSKKRFRGLICQKCSERENMPNIKITAEVNGKQVPLETISTETFEAIKALEKPKEIPMARVGVWSSDERQKRLFLKITRSIIRNINDIDNSDGNMILAIDPEDGIVVNCWLEKNDGHEIYNYKQIQPL